LRHQSFLLAEFPPVTQPTASKYEGQAVRVATQYVPALLVPP